MAFNVNIINLPSDGGSTITDLQFEKNNSGVWTSLGGVTVGSYATSAIAGDTVKIRAVNAVGNGTASASKTAVAAAVTTPGIISSAAVINSSSLSQTSFVSGSVAPVAGSNRCAVLLVSTKASGASSLADISAVWNGNAMTRLSIATFGNAANPGSAIFYLNDSAIPTTAGAITVSSTLMDGCYARLIQFEGIDQITPFGTPVTSNPNSSVAGTGVTVNVGEATSWVISVGTANGIESGYTISAGTEEYDVNVGSVIGAAASMDDVNATGNRTHTYTLVGATTRRHAVIGVELFAAG